MPLTVNISLEVPDLPDNSVAFLNNAAWVNYWRNVDVVAEFTPADNDIYLENAYNNAQQVDFNWNGQDFSVPSIEQFNSLLLAYQTLNTNYKNLRTVMKDAGFILEAQ